MLLKEDFIKCSGTLKAHHNQMTNTKMETLEGIGNMFIAIGRVILALTVMYGLVKFMLWVNW